MRNPRAPMALMTCESGRLFAEKVASLMNLPLIPTNESWFACGEGKIEIGANVRGHDLYIFQSCVGKMDKRSIYDRFMMLLHAIEAAALSDAQYITAILPYYPCSRQDKRKGRTREGISAGLFARMLQTAGANRVMTVEIHNEAIAGMFNPAHTHLENVFLTRQLSEWLKKKKLAGDVVVSPDVGYLQKARDFSEALSADLAVLSKERDYSKPNSIYKSTLIGEVAGRNVLLVDDIIDTAGSVVASIEELKNHGAANITVACIHPLLSDPAWERLESVHQRATRENWEFNLAGTSVVHHPDAPDWYHSMELENLISTIISKINSRGSVSDIH